jgi:hypothetical protein
MDGDSRTIEQPSTSCDSYDRYDAEWWEGDVIAWAVDLIDRQGVTESSLYPIGDAVPVHAWLSGVSYDPYEGDNKVTEMSVRLTGDWSEQQRAQVFHAVSRL